MVLGLAKVPRGAPASAGSMVAQGLGGYSVSAA
jgi:hypothetical protein